MTREELKEHCKKQIEMCEMWAKAKGENPSSKIYEEHKMILELLEQEPSGDAISRQSAISLASDLKQDLPDDEHMADMVMAHNEGILEYQTQLSLLPAVNPQIGYCKGCKYFEYDSLAKVDGIPLIVAHEICNRWGDGCKTKEDGYCFLYEPQERNEEE